MGIVPMRDIGAHVRSAIANYSQDASADPKVITAGATEDNTKATGDTIDRLSTNGGLASSCSLQIGYSTILADTKTLSFAVEYQDSADDSTWNTAVAMQASTVAVTSDGGTTEKGTVELNLNLSTLERYVRFNVTPDLSATGTDTAFYHAVAVLGGHQDSKKTG